MIRSSDIGRPDVVRPSYRYARAGVGVQREFSGCVEPWRMVHSDRGWLTYGLLVGIMAPVFAGLLRWIGSSRVIPLSATIGRRLADLRALKRKTFDVSRRRCTSDFSRLISGSCSVSRWCGIVSRFVIRFSNRSPSVLENFRACLDGPWSRFLFFAGRVPSLRWGHVDCGGPGFLRSPNWRTTASERRRFSRIGRSYAAFFFGRSLGLFRPSSWRCFARANLRNPGFPRAMSEDFVG